MTSFHSFHGTITEITNFNAGEGEKKGCNKFFTVRNNLGVIVNFVVSPSTYFVDHEMLVVGDRVTGYYDGNAPTVLIYPPQYRALVMVKDNPNQNVKVDFFNSQLVSSDGQLQLNLSSNTHIVLTNGQFFSGYPGNHDLIVNYGPTTRSIPAQTTPYRIVVLC
ncbi:hypothetical protein LZ480_14850 [Solibacillus sp. MA9]|uniref:IgGFc-binding protein N-terminal domain-containing protein n=1 Tax=Solibacillus palustris TaxID=2908203 RepID=A0ABS9UGS1_9BACL|nr:hypothetical protein [Solibacillus sp. MA9]MCH7323153.1 hypothetical protein [Solibacillus sp. MA9]